MVFNMLKPFLTPEVRDGVVFHSGNLATLRSVCATGFCLFLWNYHKKLCCEILLTHGGCLAKGWDNLIEHASSNKVNFFLEGWHIRVFLRAYKDVLKGITLAIPWTTTLFEKSFFNEVYHTSLYCRDYVPLDILPSDVGGNKNAPLMVSLPHESLLSVGEFLCQNMLYWNILFWTSLKLVQDNSSNVAELWAMDAFFNERKRHGFNGKM